MNVTAKSSAEGEAANWHSISADEVVKRLSTNVQKGLSAGEASGRLQKYGPNRLPAGKKRGSLMRFLTQFNNVLVYVLLGAGFVKLMLNLWIDAAIIFGQRSARIHPRGQGRKGARFDPQHVIGGSARGA